MSLSAFRDHCRRMADADDVNPRDAELWTQLADEIDDYLGENLDDDDDLHLFYPDPNPDQIPRRYRHRPIEETPPL